jgi:hypothetical protein
VSKCERSHTVLAASTDLRFDQLIFATAFMAALATA